MTARRRKKSPVKQFFSQIGRFIKLVVLSLVGLVLIGAALWLLLPYLIGISETSNYVFSQVEADPDQSSVYLVSFQPLENQVSFQPLSLKTETDLYLDQELEVKTIQDWREQFASDLDQAQQAKFYSRLVQNRIDQVISLPAEVKFGRGQDLVSTLRTLALKKGQSLSQRSQLLSLYAYAKNAELSQTEPINQIEKLEFPLLDEGQCSLAVINTTQISGLAGRVGRIAEKMGMRVIRIDSNDLNLEETKLVVGDLAKCGPTLNSTQQILLGKPKRVEDQAQLDKLLSRFRADMVILLGTDQSLES